MPAIRKKETYHLLIIILVLALTVFSVSKLPKLRFNYDFEAFFPNQDNELELYAQHRNTFDYDNEFVLLALENRAGTFQPEFLQKINQLSNELAGLPDVKQVQSPTNLKFVSYDGLLPYRSPVLHFEDTSRYHSDSVRIYNTPWLIGSWFPAGGGSVSLFIKSGNDLSKLRSDALAAAITEITGRYGFENVHLAGRIFAQKVYLEMLQSEFLLFIALAFLLVILFLWFSFRNLYIIILSLFVIGFSVIWTFAFMYFTGKDIDLMTSMLPTMIFIAGMSDVVHFFSKYFDELGKGTDRAEIYRLILKEVGFPTFLTLVTTVVAFLSLLFSEIRPVKEFGIYTSAGITFAFILTYTLLPALLHFFPPPQAVQPAKTRKDLSYFMRPLFILVLRNRKTVILTSSVFLLLAFAGISKIKQNNILLEDLAKKVRIRQDFDFFDREYSGARPLEIHVRVKDPRLTAFDYEVMKELEKVEKFILTTYQPGFLLSAPALARTFYNNANAPEDLPGKPEYEQLSALLKKNRKNKDLNRVITSDGKTTRFSGKIKDIGSRRMEALNADFRDFTGNHLTPGLLEFTFTGAGHLIDRNNTYMVKNMLQGLFFSVIVIGLLTLILHRNWRTVMIFMIPNISPLLVIGGIMGYAGIELKASTSLIFSIAFGLATDDTIHFISRFKIERTYGKSLLYALKRTCLETGKPIILTTFILFGGFISLMSSGFQSIYYFGLLICITVVVALLSDLVLLPVLFLLFYRDKNSVKPIMKTKKSLKSGGQ